MSKLSFLGSGGNFRIYFFHVSKKHFWKMFSIFHSYFFQVSWYTEIPIFTRCFRRAIFSLLPNAVFWLILPFYVYKLKNLAVASQAYKILILDRILLNHFSKTYLANSLKSFRFLTWFDYFFCTYLFTQLFMNRGLWEINFIYSRPEFKLYNIFVVSLIINYRKV
jgi:hypothetical protein